MPLSQPGKHHQHCHSRTDHFMLCLAKNREISIHFTAKAAVALLPAKQDWPYSSVKKRPHSVSNLLMFMSCREAGTHPSPWGWDPAIFLGFGGWKHTETCQLWLRSLGWVPAPALNFHLKLGDRLYLMILAEAVVPPVLAWPCCTLEHCVFYQACVSWALWINLSIFMSF